MNTTLIHHRSNSLQAIRAVGFVAILVLAAGLGIVVGNALQGAEDSQVSGQAATDTASSAFSLDAMRHLQAARGDAGAELGAPSFVDPYRDYLAEYRAANSVAPGPSTVVHRDYLAEYLATNSVAPAQTDPRPHLWAPIDNDLVAPAQTDPRSHLRAPIDGGEKDSSFDRPTGR
ncbi:MAG TPA: hypothetical protein VF364_13285 [Candidatus Limnocylindria bacterium]